MKIYNSLTKKKEDFVPLKGKSVRIYTCGATVYDLCHIGHARSLYVFDMMCRYLKFRGYDVKFVRNITDVDDKIIARANETGKTSDAVAEANIDAYYRDLASLGIGKADLEPRATENVGDMVKHIQALIDKGFAYAKDGDVYFEVRKFSDYGKLSGQSIDKMMEAVRIEKDEKKRDPLDFALWKRSKEGEPWWDSPWGRGRPGWHIECSCMSMKYLNTDTLDIHAGGRDLIFPHHENEIAQSEAYTGQPFAKYWIHHGLVTINGQKMAKSLGNFITIQDAVKKYPVDELKLLFLSSHYASPIDFTEEKMSEMHKAIQRFDVLFWKAFEMIKHRKVYDSRPVEFIENRKADFLAAMDDDFNTPQALATLFDLVNDTNKYIDRGQRDDAYTDVIFQAVDTLEHLGREIFGLFLKEQDKPLSAEMQGLLDDRKQARACKDFQRSDELRELLKQKGVAVEDTKDGQTWRWL
ncbi:MAG: cysteine--tRNA ligase [Candidatus Omnitrophota bacterium]|nr:cysteine--tRNA ligase [Candidatus Omnitrophota bacterium]